MKKIQIVITLILLTACEDKAMVNVYKKQIMQTPITCMKLSLFPEDKDMIEALSNLYPFNTQCDFVLEISHKSGIKCNSRFNVATKTTSKFPSSYLKMELRKGFSLQYSYYIDLTSKPNKTDIEKGWDRLNKDLKIVRVP